MPRLRRLAIVLSSLALMTCCTSVRPLPTVEPAALRAELKPGDEVAITTTDGKSYAGSVHALDELVLSVDCTDAQHAGQTIEIPYAELATVSTRRPHTGRTVFAALSGSAVVIFVVLSVAILVAFG